MVRLADELQAAPARNGSSTRATLCGGAGESAENGGFRRGAGGFRRFLCPLCHPAAHKPRIFIISELLVGILTRDRSRVF